MKLHILLPLALVLVASVAAAQSSPDVEAAKRAGAQAAGVGATMFPRIDAQGNPVVNPDGSMATQNLGIEAMRGGLRMFQADTGMSGVEYTGSPAARNRTGGARISVRGFADFSCAEPRTRTFNAANLAFRVTGCEVGQGNQGTVALSMCDNVLKGGMCTRDEEFGQAFQLRAGAVSTLGDMSLGLGCNSVLTCRLTVEGQHSFQGNDQSLRQQAQSAAGASSGVIADLRTAAVSNDYVARMREIGQPLVDCNAANLTAGQAASCDGRFVVRMAGPGDTGACGTARQCLEESVQTFTSTRSCTRSFSFTERISRFRYTRAFTCEVLVDDRDPENQARTTRTCQRVGAEAASPETGAEGPALGSGAENTASEPGPNIEDTTVVSRTEAQCTRHVTVGTVRECASWTWTENRIDLSESGRTTLSQAADPPVAGACDTNPLSETRFSRCTQASAWFGRTLPAEACQASFHDEAAGEAEGVLEVDFRQSPGCGICLEPEVSEVCYAQPQANATDLSCESLDLTNCQLTAATPRGFTGEGGLVASQEETYTCTTQTRQCVRYAPTSGDAACLNADMAFGADQIRGGPPKADGSMANALVAAAALDSTAQGLQDGVSSKLPLLFNGSDQRCNRAAGGFVGSLMQRNCCRLDIQRPSAGSLLQEGCTEDEARLAAARRARNAVFIGEYCSRRAPRPFRTCLRRTQTYCVFSGMLPRILHEQGRRQLDAMAHSAVGANIARTPLSFSYYDAGAGSWAPVRNIGGVRVTAWQWPSYCADPAQAAVRLMSDPLAKDCPGSLTVWFATCESNTCDDLPPEPSVGSLGWSLVSANPLENITTALTRHAVVTGACSTAGGQCQYTLSSWPVGQSGRGVMSREVSWSLFSNVPSDAPSGQPQADVFELNNLGDLVFRTYPLAGMGGTGSIPAAVRLDFSNDGGQTWQTHQLPTDLRGREITLPGTDTTVTGHCDGLTNSCDYRFTGTIEIQAKPWGSPHGPDCSGFTAGQLAAIDFGKLDLSEWLSTILPRVGAAPGRDELAELARQQFTDFNSMMSSGRVESTSPVSAQFARLTPSEGFGPFDARLLVSGHWPETTGDPERDIRPVTAVTVDWDDCSGPRALAAVPAHEGRGFRGVHRYNNPQVIHQACGRGPLRQSIRHRIRLTVQYQDAGAVRTESVVLTLENAWGNFSGTANNTANISQTIQGTPAGQGIPPPPRP